MIVYIIVCEFPLDINHDKNSPHLKELTKCFLDVFTQYQPKPADIHGTYAYPAFEMVVTAGDPKFQELLQQFNTLAKKANPPGAAILRERPTPEEAKRARFLEPVYYGNYVDEASGNDDLNSGMYACEKCYYPNLKHVPEPFWVNKTALKKYDLFGTGKSLIIVRPRLLELLKKSVGDQIQFGTAAIKNSKTTATGDDRLFWVRPKQTIGQRLRVFHGEKTCPDCKRVIPEWFGSANDHINRLGPGLFDDRYRVAHFGTGKADIALIAEAGNDWPHIAISGALMAYLQANRVKGIIARDEDYLFSAKGEPTLEPKVQTFGEIAANLEKVKQDKDRLVEARKATVALKGVPWDCANDGYVYFHLSTPEFVVLDPMTVEEDSDGPYKVKSFKGPGLYALPVSAIKSAEGEKRSIAVDSGALVFVDNPFLSDFLESYEWKKAVKKGGNYDWKYHQEIAEQIGTRFGICTTPSRKFKSEFVGDGFYTLDVKGIKLVPKP